jgi:uncharacterized membrane protein
MEGYLLDWANLLLRWLHVIAAIAWIGTSFHFVLTDDRLYKPTDPDLLDKGVDGESWAVHGGGFYHFNKYRVAPKHLPDDLHWSFWEAYTTWASGFALLTVLYFFNASSFLVDPRVHDWSAGAAIVGALAYLAIGWIVYDGICRLVGRDKQGNVGGDLKVGVLVFFYVCVSAWVACHLFAGRAAFLLTGAMLATMMSANVAMVIIPGQRKVVAALRAGETPDPNHGKRGKQRSVHNTYVTLPVIVAMLSNHYGSLVQGRWNWLALILLMAAGAVIRLFFVLRHKGPSRWELVAVALVLIAATMWIGAPDTIATKGSSTSTTAPEPVPFTRVQAIVQARCVMCHNEGFANKNVRLDSDAAIVQHARDIEQQAVIFKAMPLKNATGITDDERAALGRWVAAGAKAE